MLPLRLLLIAVLVSGAWVLAGCDTPKVSDENLLLMRETELAKQAGKPGTVVVDVRKPEAYAAGHIPGAINIYLPEIKAADPRLGSAKQIVVYGASGDDPLSTAAAKRLMSLGYQNVYDFKGGVSDWTTAGYRLESSAPAVEGRPETE